MTEERSLQYDMQGNPIGLWEWVALFGDHKNRQIGLFRNEWVMISTVWLGIDHGLSVFGIERPVIFETMVFAMEPFETGGHDTWRYGTLAEAKGGHLDMVERWTGFCGFWRLFWMTVWERATRD